MTRTDVVRQAVTVAGAVGQAVLPAVLLPRLRDELEVPDVAQPAPYAFSVWLPIYATTLAYAASQARPAQRGKPVLRAVGSPFAASLVCTAVWAPLLRRRNYWGAQAALLGTAAFAEQARTRLAAAGRRPGPAEWALLELPVGLQAGWGAAAAAVNLAAMLVDRGPSRVRRAPAAVGAGTVLAVGLLASGRVAASPPATSGVYGATVLWALAGVAAGQRRRHPPVALWAAAAAALVWRTLMQGRARG